MRVEATDFGDHTRFAHTSGRRPTRIPAVDGAAPIQRALACQAVMLGRWPSTASTAMPSGPIERLVPLPGLA